MSKSTDPNKSNWKPRKFVKQDLWTLPSVPHPAKVGWKGMLTDDETSLHGVFVILLGKKTFSSYTRTNLGNGSISSEIK